MKLKNLLSIFIIYLLILSFIITPSICGKNFFSNEDSYNSLIKSEQEAIAEVYTYNFQKNGTLITDYKTISLDDVISFIDYFEKNTNNSLVKEFNQLTTCEKPSEIDLDSNNNSTNGFHFNVVCNISCRLIGLGLVIGGHSTPAGYLTFLKLPNIFGGFLGIGSIETKGFMGEKSTVGKFCIGGFIGFYGTILFIFIPSITGPIIFIEGFALITMWI